MAAETEARHLAFPPVQPCPFTDARFLPIRADYPAAWNNSTVEDNSFIRKPAYRRSPNQRDACLSGSINERLMQMSPTDAQPKPVGKGPIDRTSVSQKPDAPKSEREPGIKLHSKARERLQSVGHKPFAAGFIYRGAGAVGNDDPKPSMAQSDCRRQTGWPSTDDEHVRLPGYFS